MVNLARVGDYIFVKVFTEKNRHQNFIAIILDVPDENRNFEVIYIKRFQKIKVGVLFAEVKI